MVTRVDELVGNKLVLVILPWIEVMLSVRHGLHMICQSRVLDEN